MSVIVKGMKMPKSCGSCFVGDRTICHDGCPLGKVPTPVKHGKWIGKSTGGWHFTCCSECGYVEWNETNNYCPNCGARMDEE